MDAHHCDVVVCDGDENVRRWMAQVLTSQGHVVQATGSADFAADICEHCEPPPLLVTDVPRLRRLAQRHAPLLERQCQMCLAIVDGGSSAPSLDALQAGADAVLTRPVDGMLLVAQVEAIHRRDLTRRQRVRFGRFVLDVEAGTLQHEERPIALTPTELLLLARLARQMNRVVSKAELARAGWGQGHVTSNTLAVHLGALRRKLCAVAPNSLQTVRGRGVRLVGSSPERG